jgi:hypothetical protein
MNKIIRSNNKFIADDGSATDLVADLQASPLAMSRGDPTGLVLYHFDIKKYGEATTRPDIRIPPMRDCYTRLVKAVLRARQPPSDDVVEVDDDAKNLLQTGEIAILLDGGKHGNKSKLQAPWLPAKKGGTPISFQDLAVRALAV